MSPVITLVGCCIAAIACHGWGWIACRAVKAWFPWAVTAVLGLAVVCVVGAVLNLMSIAYPAALDAVVVVGLGLAGLAAIRDRPPRAEIVRLLTALAALAIPVAFVARFTVPTTTFMSIDDLEKYLAYPIRMLATGTVSGSTMSAMGFDTLGTQAFLQAFVLAHFPLTCVNAADAVFGLFLTLLVVLTVDSGAAPSSGSSRAWTLATRCAAMAVVVTVPPLYANISTLYFAIAMICGLMAALTVHRSADLSADTPSLPPAILGIMPAAVAAMKPSFALFFVFLLATLAIGFTVTEGWKKAAIWLAKVVGWAMVGLVPWVAVHHANYLAALTMTTPLPEADIVAMPPLTRHVDLLSANPTLWHMNNGTVLCFTLAVAAAAAAAAIEAVRARHHPIERRRRAMVGAAFALAGLILYVVVSEYAFQTENSHGLRYIVPVLIAVFAGLPMIFAAYGGADRVSRVLWLAVPVFIAVMFAPTLPPRIQLTENGYSLFAMPQLSTQDYTRQILSPAAQDRLRKFQQLVPAGEPILVWVGANFLLDFARNPIIDVDHNGLGTPWARLPKARYLIWEYPAGVSTFSPDFCREEAKGRDPMVALLGRRALALSHDLTAIIGRRKILSRDGNVLFIWFPDNIPDLLGRP